jgi:hypothetical protein
MRGYIELRGHAAKIDFDEATNQFVLLPLDHRFTPEEPQNGLLEKVRQWRAAKHMEKAQRDTLAQLIKLTSEQHNDLGLQHICLPHLRICVRLNSVQNEIMVGDERLELPTSSV